MPSAADIKHLADLTVEEREQWDALRASDPALHSPYFARSYLEAVNAVRPGVRVLCLRGGDGESIGFLPFRLSPLGTARPADGAVSDLHGVIARPETSLDLPAALQTAGIGGYVFSAMPYQQYRHGCVGQSGDGNQIVDLRDGRDAYYDERYALNSNFRRLHRKTVKVMERDDVVIRHNVVNAEGFERLIEWKRAGYQAAGHFDIFSVAWPEALLHRLIESPGSGAAGIFSTLHIGDQLVAACFCMRSETVLHYWFPGYDAAFANEKPGHAMLFSLVDWAAEEGIREIHLGLGDYQYKRMMASYAAPVRQGYLAVASPQKLAGRLNAWTRDLERSRGGVAALPAKLARKYQRMTLSGSLKA